MEQIAEDKKELRVIMDYKVIKTGWYYLAFLFGYVGLVDIAMNIADSKKLCKIKLIY